MSVSERRHHINRTTEGNAELSIPLDISYGFNINPKINIGEVKSYPGRRKVCRRKDGHYVVYQLICVEIPYDIDVDIDYPDNILGNNDNS